MFFFISAEISVSIHVPQNKNGKTVRNKSFDFKVKYTNTVMISSAVQRFYELCPLVQSLRRETFSQTESFKREIGWNSIVEHNKIEFIETKSAVSLVGAIEQIKK